MTPYLDIHTHRRRLGKFDRTCVIDTPFGFLDHRISPTPNNVFSCSLPPSTIDSVVQFENFIARLKALKYFCYWAVGEVGFDKRIPISVDVQLNYFIEIATFAEQRGMPLVIHWVGRYDLLIECYKKVNPSCWWIIHGYRKNVTWMHQLLELPQLSISLGLLFDESVARLIPLNRLFLETDDSEIEIDAVYEKFARIRGVDIEELRAIIYDNFITIRKRKQI